MAVRRPVVRAEEPSLPLLRILSLDLMVVVSGVLLAGVWLVALFAMGLGYLPVGFGRIVFSAAEIVSITGVTLALTLLGAPFLVWRIFYFRSILRNGIVVKGQIIRRWVTFAEYRVDYVFQHHYQPFQQRNAIRRQRHIEARSNLEPGNVVQILVHPYMPERSLLIELYRP